MTADFNTTRYILPKLSKGNYTALMKMLHNLYTFDTSDAAKFRLYVLDFFYRHGWRATVEAFKISKSTLYDWKKMFEKSGKKVSSLIPQSTRPKRTRTMNVDPRITEFIRRIREEYGRVSKYKLKIFINEYTKEIGI